VERLLKVMGIRIYFSVLFILIGVHLFAQENTLLHRSETLEKANRLFEQQRYDVALSFYKSLVSDGHSESLVLFRKGFSYLECLYINDAIRIFEKLLGKYPDHSQGLFYMAYALRMQGHYERAGYYYQKLKAINPELGTYWEEVNTMISLLSPSQKLFSNVKPLSRQGSHELFIAMVNDQIICSSTSMEYEEEQKRFSGPDHNRGTNRLCLLDPNTNTLKRFERTNFDLYNTSHVSFSSYTGMVAYMRNNFFPGMRQVAQINKDLDIFFAYLDENGNWIEEIPFEYNDLSYSTGYPFLTENGQTLYFASNMPGGYGGFDLYVCYLTEEGWSLPQNLGPRINTPGNEICPYFDGNHLYFSSDWHPGYGGLDIFRTDFDYESWETPENLGNSINSSLDDFGFVFFDKFNKGYFISNRDTANRSENLYEFTRTSKKIHLQITDYKKRTPITGVVIDLGRCGMGSGITDESGEYSFFIQEGFDCYVGFSKVGYTTSTLKLKYSGIESQKKVIKIMLNATGNFFKGKIIVHDNDSLMSVSGVYVSAINEVDGELQETYSDDDGFFDLQIKPRGRYFLSFAKTGYRPVYRNIRTENKVPDNILEDVFLERADNLVIRDVFNKSPKEAALDTSTLIMKLPEKEKKKNAQDTGMTSKSPSGSDKKLYVVQVAAIARRNIDISPFKNHLSGIGTLYFTQRDDNLIRIMVGVYNTRSEALDALNRVKNNDKFGESFITEVPLGVELYPLDELIQRGRKNSEIVNSKPKTETRTDSVTIKSEKKDESPSHNQPKQITTEQNVILNKERVNEYMVQIGRFKNLNWFDNRAIEKIGLIEERREGGYVLVLLSGYVNLQEAIDAREKVKGLGYKDAFIVTPGQNGELFKVKN
jgi:cell division septation protein DedD